MSVSVIMYFGTLGFILILVIILIFVRTEKIKVIGDFIKKTMPSIPITHILKILRKQLTLYYINTKGKYIKI